jgi:hypothetical protein
MLGSGHDLCRATPDGVIRWNVDDADIWARSIATRDFAMLEVASRKREHRQHEPNHHGRMLALVVRSQRMMIATSR